MVNVREITSLGRTTIYKLVKSGQFPAPKKIFSNRVVWSTSEVLAWMESRGVK
ncbi:helix-turn-helix transcriptional regulator [Acidithiobacillus thiooxidans]